MGPKYNVATGREELGSTISYWRNKHHSKRAKVPNLVQAQPNRSRLLPQEEARDIHSFNICPKASHGTQIQCCNRQQRIGQHHIILEEQTSFEEGQSAEVPNLVQAAKSQPFAPMKRI